MSRLPAALWMLGLTGRILKSRSWTVTLRLESSDILLTWEGVRGGPGTDTTVRMEDGRHASGDKNIKHRGVIRRQGIRS